jgi:hypothetical protein
MEWGIDSSWRVMSRYDNANRLHCQAILAYMMIDAGGRHWIDDSQRVIDGVLQFQAIPGLVRSSCAILSAAFPDVGHNVRVKSGE